MYNFRYSRWDGSQQIFDLDEEDLMEQLADDMMANGDVASALRSMMQRGLRGSQGQRTAGIQQLLQRLRDRRKELTDRYDLGSVLDNIQQELRDIVAQERRGIDQRVTEMQDRLRSMQEEGAQDTTLEEQLLQRMEQMASQNREFLDRLPPDTPGQLGRLQDYEFTDQDAKQRFDQLLQSLQQQFLDSHIENLSQTLENLTPQHQQALREMVRDLNQMLEQRARGEEPDFQQFMDRWGSMFGDNPPQSLDDLLQQMQQQIAQMESLLNSMSPEQRQELQDLLNATLKDPGLRDELSRLAANMEHLQPTGRLQRQYPFQGDESLGLQEAMELMDRLHQMEDLERNLRKTQHGANLTDIDSRQVHDLLGDEAGREFQQLQELSRALEESGYIRKMGNRYELTPKGMRRIGQKALREIFSVIKKSRSGGHTTPTYGQGSESTHETKPYEYGDPFTPDLRRSLMNSVIRSGGGTPVRMSPEDFEIHRMEQLAQASTVLMIDLSLSMAMRGNFLAAKKVALALDNLIRTQFPRDSLYIVGFSTYARELKPEQLAYLSWDEFDPYTNIQHGLLVSQKLLSRFTGGSKQIIMVSDGEPTAHMESGQLFLQYPPSPRTLRETLREVRRCTQQDIVINTFMLDRNSYLIDFVDQMSKINRGRVFFTSPERLGQYVLVDYYGNRKRRNLS